MGSRIALVAAGLLLVLAVILLARPDAEQSPSIVPSAAIPVPVDTASVAPSVSPTATAREIDVEVAGGVVTSPLTAEVPVGAPVVLRITADVADEVHLHGYDLETEVAPGAPGEIAFTADSPGVFEVEFHGSGLLLLRLTVTP